jgi:hypothetical protein
MQLKMDFANNHYLGGTLIWAIDQDGDDHISSNDLLGVGIANGVSAQEAELYREVLANTSFAASKQNSCYWSFCRDSCVAGYFAQTYAPGQVVGIDRDSSSLRFGSVLTSPP